jgi:hypothetical protein
MFRKKSDAAPAPAKAKAPSNFNAKEFMLMNVEKMIFGLVGLLAAGLIYMGFTGETFPKNKAPDTLRKQAETALRQLQEEDHWQVISEQDKTRAIEVRYAAKAVSSREKVEVGLYPLDVYNTKGLKGGIRRGDPTLLAPLELEVTYFSGQWAQLAGNSKVPLEDNPNAKKPEPPRRPAASAAGPGMPPGYGESGPPPGMGPGGMSMGPTGMAGGDPTARLLSAGFNKGFKDGMKTFTRDLSSPDPADPSPVSTSNQPKKLSYGKVDFVAITAIAPHELLEDNYRKELAEASEYMEGRDNPVYQGFEIQRAEIKLGSEPAEADWKSLASSEQFKEWAKSWPGSCSEVHKADWVTPNLAMPIPPILLDDYTPIASHSKVETESKAQDFDDDEPTAAASMTAGGYPGGGYPGAGGPDMSAMMQSMQNMQPDYGASMRTPGGPGGPGGLGPMGGMGAITVEAPKKLPSTKYKLIRFYDMKIETGKVYRYRIRLKMYDPNFPEYEALAPKNSNLKAEAVKRVQELMDTVKADPKTKKRVSVRLSDWSIPSASVSTYRAPLVYAGTPPNKGIYTPIEGSNDYYESVPAKIEAVFGEWYTQVLLPRKETISRGMIFGAKPKDGFEPVIPTTGVVKSVKPQPVKSAIAVVDVKGGVPLENRVVGKDAIHSGGELMAIDPATGQLIVAREFDDYIHYNRLVQPDGTATGPLAGGAGAPAAGASPGMSPGAPSGDMASEPSGAP